MFKKTPKETDGLENAITVLLHEMSGHQGDSEEYAKMVVQLDVLYKLKEVDSKKRVSADTLAIIGANLLGIVMIVGHERANVVTSKALGLLSKLR